MIQVFLLLDRSSRLAEPKLAHHRIVRVHVYWLRYGYGHTVLLAVSSYVIMHTLLEGNNFHFTVSGVHADV